MDELKHTPWPLRCDRKCGQVDIGNFFIVEPATDEYEPCTAYVANIDDARLYAASPLMLKEMERYLVILERAESLPHIWNFLSKGTGIATVNGYRYAIANASPPA